VKRHPVRVAHLVMGLLFTVFVVVWALVETDVVDHRGLRWLVPVPFLVAGAIGLGVTALGSRRRD
jgi:hypothetical protein